MKIRPVGAELSHADGRTDRHDEANSRFSQFCETAYKLQTTKIPDQNSKAVLPLAYVSRPTAVLPYLTHYYYYCYYYYFTSFYFC